MGSSPGRDGDGGASTGGGPKSEPLLVRCPHCRQEINFPGETAQQLRSGATLPCPHCGRLIRL